MQFSLDHEDFVSCDTNLKRFVVRLCEGELCMSLFLCMYVCMYYVCMYRMDKCGSMDGVQKFRVIAIK